MPCFGDWEDGNATYRTRLLGHRGVWTSTPGSAEEALTPLRLSCCVILCVHRMTGNSQGTGCRTGPEQTVDNLVPLGASRMARARTMAVFENPPGQPGGRRQTPSERGADPPFPLTSAAAGGGWGKRGRACERTRPKRARASAAARSCHLSNAAADTRGRSHSLPSGTRTAVPATVPCCQGCLTVQLEYGLWGSASHARESPPACT